MGSWLKIKNSISDVFDAESIAKPFERKRIRSAIMKASAMGANAAEEVRIRRLPWKQLLFEEAVLRAMDIRISLSSIEYCVADGDCKGRKSLFCLTMFRRPSFLQVKKMMLEKASLIETMLRIFVHDEVGPMEELKDTESFGSPWNDNANLWNKAIRNFVVDKIRNSGELCQGCSLDGDNVAQMSLIIV